jgi:hypothetical protein
MAENKTMSLDDVRALVASGNLSLDDLTALGSAIAAETGKAQAAKIAEQRKAMRTDLRSAVSALAKFTREDVDKAIKGNDDEVLMSVMDEHLKLAQQAHAVVASVIRPKGTRARRPGGSGSTGNRSNGGGYVFMKALLAAEPATRFSLSDVANSETVWAASDGRYTTDNRPSTGLAREWALKLEKDGYAQPFGPDDEHRGVTYMATAKLRAEAAQAETEEHNNSQSASGDNDSAEGNQAA